MINDQASFTSHGAAHGHTVPYVQGDLLDLLDEEGVAGKQYAVPCCPEYFWFDIENRIIIKRVTTHDGIAVDSVIHAVQEVRPSEDLPPAYEAAWLRSSKWPDHPVERKPFDEMSRSKLEKLAVVVAAGIAAEESLCSDVGNKSLKAFAISTT